MPVFRQLVVASVLFLLIASAATAGTMELAWDAVSGAAGYRVHYGTAPGSYTQVHDVGPSTSATITGLADCTEYFVAVKAYNDLGESPQFSGEVSGWARPEIRDLDPGAVRQGDLFTMNVRGANFASGAEVDWTGTAIPLDSLGTPLIRFDSVRVLSCSLIQALVTVESAIRGQRAMQIGELFLAVEVVNPDAVYGAGTHGVEIRFAPARADINRSDDSTRDRVDGHDLAWLAYAYGAVDGGNRYNPDADLDGDGLVDGNDLALLAPRFGRCWDGVSWDLAACN